MKKLVNNCHRPEDRKGAMLVLIAVLMVLFMVIAAFCVDIAYMHMVNAEMRTAVDAASRAGTESLSRNQDRELAIQAALDFAESNSVAGDGLTLNRSDVRLGSAVESADGTFEFQSGGERPNSVSVFGRRDDQGPDGSVGLFFGNVFGVDSFTPAANSVATSSVRDIALVLDRSGSMNTPSGVGTRLTALVDAVNVFLDEIEESSPNSKVSLTTYATNSTRDLPLSADFEQLLNSVNVLQASGFTNIFQALRQGSDSLEQDPERRNFAEKTIVLLTDGNFNVGGTPIPSAVGAAARNHTIHTITFSDGADQATMRQCADIGGGLHIHADDGGDLAEAFREIARTLAVVLIE